MSTKQSYTHHEFRLDACYNIKLTKSPNFKGFCLCLQGLLQPNFNIHKDFVHDYKDYINPLKKKDYAHDYRDYLNTNGICRDFYHEYKDY